jgi:predicted nuclease of restriction endonuclease-like (RecB) superfamily
MNDMILPADYQDWVKMLKNRIQAAQQRAVLAVNQELLQLYWQIGRDILLRQHEQGWGAKVIERLAQDLRSAFPALKGFSRANLLYMRSFAENWPDFQSDPNVQQAVGQIPWGHNLILISKLKLREAHHNLDLAVDRLYRSRPFTSDEERLEHLFKLYEEMTAKEELI